MAAAFDPDSMRPCTHQVHVDDVSIYVFKGGFPCDAINVIDIFANTEALCQSPCFDHFGATLKA